MRSEAVDCTDVTKSMIILLVLVVNIIDCLCGHTVHSAASAEGLGHAMQIMIGLSVLWLSIYYLTQLLCTNGQFPGLWPYLQDDPCHTLQE